MSKSHNTKQRQISLRSLMIWTTAVPPVVALSVGGFGELAARMFWSYVVVIVWSVTCFLCVAVTVFLPTMALVSLVEWTMGMLAKRDRRREAK